MPINKHITMIVMLIVFHHVLAPWAKGEDASAPAATEQQQESHPLWEQPSGNLQQSESPPAVDTIQSSPSDTISKPETFGPEMGFIDALHNVISRRILTTAVWLDSFFSDERFISEENRSYVRTRFEVFKEELTDATFRPYLDLRLALPHLEKKARIVVSAESAENPATTTAPPGAAPDRISTTEARNFTTALDYVLRDTAQQNFVVRSGAQFSRGSPSLFIAPRYRYYVPLNTWGFRFTQEEIYNTITRWQVKTVFDLERRLPHDLFFRSSANGSWIETSTGYFYGLNFSLRHPLDVKRALDYEWNNSYHTRPVNELTEVLFKVRYRQSFWRDWVFFELAPQYRFPRDRNFSGTAGILFKFEMFFGR